ncbi:HNH endonuclease [Reyranella sp.]|uniref:HNH endonuclease n=1 Tax=Reyranella sp. TaxID=1929291 RepID=UPI004036BCBD
MAWGFQRGRVYNRRADIHGRFGGQQQGGIVTPSRFGLVVIITGEEGHQHGYEDRFRPDGTFEYFGEGQVGDMTLTRGNLAIAEHTRAGKSLLLFRKVRGGVQFEGEMVCEGLFARQSPDRTGELRKALVFELRPLEALDDADMSARAGTAPLEELRARAIAAATTTVQSSVAKRTVYERSQAVREYVLARSGGNCEGCGCPAPFKRPDGTPYMEAHHLLRLSDGGPDHPQHVIALCPTCHRRVHAGDDGSDYNARLTIRIGKIELD